MVLFHHFCNKSPDLAFFIWFKIPKPRSFYNNNISNLSKTALKVSRIRMCCFPIHSHFLCHSADLDFRQNLIYYFRYFFDFILELIGSFFTGFYYNKVYVLWKSFNDLIAFWKSCTTFENRIFSHRTAENLFQSITNPIVFFYINI